MAEMEHTTTHRDGGAAANDRRQIDFEPLQTHAKSFELTMVVLAIACAIVVVLILLATNLGNEFRPTV